MQRGDWIITILWAAGAAWALCCMVAAALALFTEDEPN